jgi:hypothetical protein
MRLLPKSGMAIGRLSPHSASRRTFATAVDTPLNGRERVVILGSGWAGEEDQDQHTPRQ